MFTVFPMKPLRTEIETFEEAIAAKVYLEGRGLLCLTCSKAARYPGWDNYCVRCTSSDNKTVHNTSDVFDWVLLQSFLGWLEVVFDKRFKDSRRVTDYPGLPGAQEPNPLNVGAELLANRPIVPSEGDVPIGGAEGGRITLEQVSGGVIK